MTVAAAEDYSGIVSHRVAAERHALAADWLRRLHALLSVDANEVFPSQQLLDHIPDLIGEVAGYLRAPAEEEIAANAIVVDKARELGILRFSQQASVHQLMREYEILAEILEAFVVDETERLGLRPSSGECFGLLRRLTRSSRALMRTTIDTFVSEYTTAIDDRNNRIKAFNQMASHELRSPIGTLVFASAALEREDVRADGDRVSKIAATVRANAHRLSWLVDNLQRVSRLTEPGDGPNEQLIEVSTLAHEVARQLQDMALARSVRIVVAAGLPHVFGDPARLELVLLNLVSNGIKYSDPGKAGSFVEIGPVAETAGVPDGMCAIRVRDNGLGIAEADRSSIFERFFRAHAHLDGSLGITGSGLGLAIAADCVRAMGGSIDCASVLGEGTTFLITLPMTTTASGAQTAAPQTGG